jgi:hypothetical protein
LQLVDQRKIFAVVQFEMQFRRAGRLRQRVQDCGRVGQVTFASSSQARC